MADDRVDAVDRRVAAALQVNGRASWGQIARALELPERTVARRGQALLDRGLVRVSTYVDIDRVLHARAVILSIRTRRAAVRDVARAIATRNDASSVSVLESGDELACMVLPRDDRALRSLLFHDLGELEGVEAAAASTVLRFYRSGYDWRTTLLTLEEEAALEPPTLRVVDPEDSISDEERSIIDMLVHDGRVPVAELARGVHMSVATVRRRMESLVARGLMRPRTEVMPSVFGLRIEALVWLRVPMDRLDEVGAAIATAPEVKFVAAVTGSSQLLVNVLTTDEGTFMDFLTGPRIARHAGLEVENSRLVVSSVLRGSLLVDRPDDEEANPRLPTHTAKSRDCAARLG